MILLILSIIVAAIPSIILFIRWRLSKLMKDEEYSAWEYSPEAEKKYGACGAYVTVMKTRKVLKYKINMGDKLFEYGLIQAPLLIGLVVELIFIISFNTFTPIRQNEAKINREVLVKKYEYYDNYGTDFIKNDSALLEYTQTLKDIASFNKKVYFVKSYKDDPWIGLFTDKGYVGLEPISIKEGK